MHRVMYLGLDDSLYEKIGNAEPDERAGLIGDFHEGCWYFYPDGEEILGGYIVDEDELSFDEDM